MVFYGAGRNKETEEEKKDEGKLYLRDRRTEEKRMQKKMPLEKKAMDRAEEKSRWMEKKKQEREKAVFFYEGKQEKTEEYELQKNHAMFWLRCIMAMMLFAMVVLADTNHLVYQGISVQDIKNSMADTLFIEQAGEIAEEYVGEYLRSFTEK